LLADDDVALAAFERRVASLCSPALEDLAEPAADEPDLVSKVRGLLLTLVAVVGGDADARSRARVIYDRWSADAASVDADLAAAATVVVAATGDEADYERMLDQYRNGSTPQIQLRHLHLLAEFESEALMQRTLELAMSGEVKTQNAPFVLRGAIGNVHHGRTAWEFVRQHWTQINEMFPRNTIGRIVETVKTLDRPADVVQTQAFFSEHPIEQAAKTLEQILERQRVNAEVRARNEQPLGESLR
jgi:puromycin-sensitive aminopeptidase